MSEHESAPTTTLERIRYTTTDVTKIVVFVAGMLFQYFTFKNQVRENALQQQNREALMTLRLDAVEGGLKNNNARVDALYQQPAMKPKPITIVPDEENE